MPNPSPELAALLVRLSSEQQQTFLAIAQNAPDQKSFDDELAKHPELLTALQRAADPDQSGMAKLQSILQELSQPAESLDEMIRRGELCRQVLAAIDPEENAELWGALHDEIANILVQVPQGSQADNFEQAITHCRQALGVYTRQAYPEQWATTQHHLANAYSNRICGGRSDNLEQAITHYQRALEVRTQQSYPEQWAATQNNLALAYVERIRGERANNLEQAIACYRRALAVYTRQTYPSDWAMTQKNLGYAYYERICGEREDNLEQAIVHCQQALKVYTRQLYPTRWAAIKNNLADACRKRIRGERANNLEQAIIHCQQALEVYTRQAYPQDWAATQNNLGLAYSERICGERVDNLEQAIIHYEQALVVYIRETSPKQWAITQHNLALALSKRMCGERAENLEQAISHCQQALEVRTRQAYPQDWSATQNNLGLAYGARIYGERANNLEQAITHLQQALEIRTRQTSPEDWAMTQNNLGEMYLARIRGERADNLERAITHYEQALTVFTRQACLERWVMTQNNLALVYVGRLCGEQADNLEQAITHYQQALEVISRKAFPEHWAMTQHNLALTYSNRIHGERADNRDQAIFHYEQALEVYSRHAYPQDWAMTQHNLADTYSKRMRGEPADNLEQAIFHYEQALEVYTRHAYPQHWAMTQNNLGLAYRKRIHGERANNLELAIAHYQQALEVRTLMRFPVDFQQTQVNLGDIYFSEKEEWIEALEAYQQAIRAEKVLLAAAYTEVGRRAEIAQTSPHYARAAYALLKLGRAGEALVQLERGKTRLLSQALALDELALSSLPVAQQETLRSMHQMLRELESEMCLPQGTPARRDDRTLADALEQARSRLNRAIETICRDHPDFMPDGLELGEILAFIPQDTMLVAPVITLHGSAVFIVPADMRSLTLDHVLWLPDFRIADLHCMLQGPAHEEHWGGWLGVYFNAYLNENAWAVWLDTIETTGQVLWDRLMAPIAQRLGTLPTKWVWLMPQGGLGLLPLHAAWREVNSERRYFVDDYPISYVSSAYVQQVSQNRLRDSRRRAHTLFAVVNPTEDLPFTPAEGEQVASLFGKENSIVRAGDKATSQVVMGAGASYLHFACHGLYNWRDPMQSGLVLARGERLTLAQIISQLTLDTTRLVTLSACETGITDIRQSPDEYLGLPAGFLQAGAPAVVSTLWAVNDLSTMLLMEHFYKLHLQQEQDPSHALQQAQIWLRNLTAGELAERFADAEEALLLQTNAHAPQETVSTYFARFASQDRANRPFAHPYYWAAFTFSGA